MLGAKRAVIPEHATSFPGRSVTRSAIAAWIYSTILLTGTILPNMGTGGKSHSAIFLKTDGPPQPAQVFWRKKIHSLLTQAQR
jgi:hypothetical protein